MTAGAWCVSRPERITRPPGAANPVADHTTSATPIRRTRSRIAAVLARWPCRSCATRSASTRPGTTWKSSPRTGPTIPTTRRAAPWFSHRMDRAAIPIGFARSQRGSDRFARVAPALRCTPQPLAPKFIYHLEAPRPPGTATAKPARKSSTFFLNGNRSTLITAGSCSARRLIMPNKQRGFGLQQANAY